MTPLVTRGSFPAMSVAIGITGVGVPPAEVAWAVEHGERLAAEWEAQFSRFRSDSQLMRLNAANGAAVRLDPLFIAMLETARAAVQRTGGRFDPSILPALEAAGYDRTIGQVRAVPRGTAGRGRPAAGIAGWQHVHIDRVRSEVRLPPGMRIDLGGMAKGAFVDRLAAELARWPGGAIDAGGDLRVWGTPPDGERWVIGIEDPFDPAAELWTAQLHAPFGAGVATSGSYHRRWQAAGKAAHHLIDPRRGVPVAEHVRSVTAFAADTRTADIAATSLLIAAAEGECADLFGAAGTAITYENGQTVMLPEDHGNATFSTFPKPAGRTA